MGNFSDPPIVRIARWFDDRREQAKRPDGILRCDFCGGQVFPGHGYWDPANKEIACSSDCAIELIAWRSGTL